MAAFTRGGTARTMEPRRATGSSRIECPPADGLCKVPETSPERGNTPWGDSEEESEGLDARACPLAGHRRRRCPPPVSGGRGQRATPHQGGGGRARHHHRARQGIGGQAPSRPPALGEERSEE